MLFIPKPKLPTNFPHFLSQLCCGAIEGSPKKLKNKKNQTPWQEISRSNVGQLEDGACIMSRDQYLDITKTKGVLRNSH